MLIVVGDESISLQTSTSIYKPSGEDLGRRQSTYLALDISARILARSRRYLLYESAHKRTAAWTLSEAVEAWT